MDKYVFKVTDSKINPHDIIFDKEHEPIISEDLEAGILNSNFSNDYLKRAYPNNSSKIISMEIPNGVKKLCSGSLRISDNLMGVVIPESVEELEENIFADPCSVKYALIENNKRAEEYLEQYYSNIRIIKKQAEYEEIISRSVNEELINQIVNAKTEDQEKVDNKSVNPSDTKNNLEPAKPIEPELPSINEKKVDNKLVHQNNTKNNTNLLRQLNFKETNSKRYTYSDVWEYATISYSAIAPIALCFIFPGASLIASIVCASIGLVASLAKIYGVYRNNKNIYRQNAIIRK